VKQRKIGGTTWTIDASTFELFQGLPDVVLAAVAVDAHMHLYDLQKGTTMHAYGLVSERDRRASGHKQHPSIGK
jgi:hypothetical protein